MRGRTAERGPAPHLIVMWQIKNPELKPATLDFSSSEQGQLQVSQLFSEGIQLINAVELVAWDMDDMQFLICEACGYLGCKSGDWVSVRQSDSLVLILPSSDYIWGESADKTEYGPPVFLKKGIPYLDFSTYESLRSRHSSFPAIDRIQPLKLREAALLFQWDAPERILGEPPEVSIRADMFVGSSEGDHGELLNKLEAVIEKQYKVESRARLRTISDNERVISLYVHGAEFMEWKAIVFNGSEHRLLVDSKYVVDC